MQVLQAVRGRLLLPNVHAGRLSLSPAPAILPHPLKLRPRESAGTFQLTVPGQLLNKCLFRLLFSLYYCTCLLLAHVVAPS